MPSHTLLALVLLPLIAALVVRLLPDRVSAGAARQVAVLMMAVQVAMAFPLWRLFNPKDPEFQFVERVAGVALFGLDGISLLLSLTLALVGLASALSVPFRSDEQGRKWVASVLLAQAGAIGVLQSVNGVGLIVCWLLTIAGLLGVSRSARTHASADGGGTVAVGSALVFACAVLVVVLSAASRAAGSGAVVALHSSAAAFPVAGASQWVALLSCLAVAALAMLLYLLVEDDGAGQWFVPGSMLLTLAPYMLLRVGLPMLPDAVRTAAPVLVAGGVAGALVLGVRALREPRLTTMVALLAASQTGVVIAGAATLGPDGLAGAVLHQPVIAMSGVAALLFTRGAVARRDGQPGGQWLPRLCALAAFVSGIAMVVGGGAQSGARLQWSAFSADGPIAFAGALAVAVAGAAALGRLVRMGWSGDAPDERVKRLGAGGGVTAVLLVGLVLLVSSLPASTYDRVTVSALKVASRIDPSYKGAFDAACDTTVTEELKAANPANQFLSAAPCGPNGEPLPAGSQVSPPSGVPVSGR